MAKAAAAEKPNTDPTFILLAIKTAGGRSVPVKGDALKVFAPKLVKECVKQEYLESVKEAPADGGPRARKVEVYHLTEKGEAKLQEAVPAVSRAAKAMVLKSLQERLHADHHAMREMVKAALEAKSKDKDIDKTHKELETLNKKLADLAIKVHAALEKSGSGGGSGSETAVLERVDAGFRALSHTVEQALVGLPHHEESMEEDEGEEKALEAEAGEEGDEIEDDVEEKPELKPEPKPAPTTRDGKPHGHTAGTAELGKLLHQTYERLCLLSDYRDDKLVELPHLYDELQKLVPDLSVKAYHDELLRLEQDRKAELFILNETRDARDAEKAIHGDDGLLYFVKWK